jgi:dCTP deaminase
VATATSVAPGFKGCITLELVNHGEVPIMLYPGTRVCQIAFRSTSGAASYEGRYECPTGPQFPRLASDKDLAWITSP